VRADLAVPEGGRDPLAEVPFGRNRFLAWLGAGVFGTATGLILRSEPADAHHTTGTPYPCRVYRRCHRCSGSRCTYKCYRSRNSECPTGGQCWFTRTRRGLYRCCDWRTTVGGRRRWCVCSGKVRVVRR
jgi:hypothetical protein